MKPHHHRGAPGPHGHPGRSEHHGHHGHPRHGDPLDPGAHRRRERRFESGDVRLLVLHLLQAQPRHGYEVIRALGELVGGDYTPSPGTIYPTLTLLEDLGHAQVSEAQGRKQYAITPEGEAELQAQLALLPGLLDKLQQGQMRHAGHRPPEILRAMDNLKAAMRLRIDRTGPDADLVQAIAGVIDRAAQDIERL